MDYSIAFLEDDYTEFWVISTKIQELNPKFTEDEIIIATRTIVVDLITNHSAVLIDVNNEKPINKTTSELIATINEHLNTIGTIPNIGDGLWMSIENNSV